MSEVSDNDLVFKALADRTRRKLLDLLNANDSQTLSELCEHLEMTRQAVTQHLGVLEAANLVTTSWRGREKLHRLNPMPLTVPFHHISPRDLLLMLSSHVQIDY